MSPRSVTEGIPEGCPECGGPWVRCEECGGTGQYANGALLIVMDDLTCMACGGSGMYPLDGYAVKHECGVCGREPAAASIGENQFLGTP